MAILKLLEQKNLNMTSKPIGCYENHGLKESADLWMHILEKQAENQLSKYLSHKKLEK